MGNSHSLYSPAFETFISNYESIDEQPEIQLGNIMQKRVNKSERILLATKVFEISTDLEASMKLAQTLHDFNHPNLSNILAHSEKNEFQCLSQTFRHVIAVEYPSNCLKDLTRTKTESVKEPHCWYILKTLADVCNYMTKSNLPIGEISPSNVMIDDNGEIKLLNLDLLTDYRTCLERAFNIPGYKTTFAPEQLERLNHLNREIDGLDIGKAEVFGIGMTVLCVASDEYIDAYYEWSNYVVNFDRIVKRINQLKDRGFTEVFIKLLANLLDPQPDNRVSLTELVYKIDEQTNPLRKRGLSTILGIKKR